MYRLIVIRLKIKIIFWMIFKFRRINFVKDEDWGVSIIIHYKLLNLFSSTNDLRKCITHSFGRRLKIRKCARVYFTHVHESWMYYSILLWAWLLVYGNWQETRFYSGFAVLLRLPFLHRAFVLWYGNQDDESFADGYCMFSQRLSSKVKELDVRVGAFVTEPVLFFIFLPYFV